MAGTLNITSTTVTGQSGTKIISVAITAANPVLSITEVAFASGTSVTVTSPIGATLAVIDPPSSNLIGLTLKGVSADTGIPLQTNQPAVITFATPSSANTFVLTSAAAVTTGNVEISFM